MRLPDGFHSPPVAHRGLWEPEGLPENSLAAITAAVDAGYGVEFDVRLSQDDVPMVFHDESLERMTRVDLDVSNMTEEELAPLRLNRTLHTIPNLKSVLKAIGGRTMAFVELKTPDGAEGVLEEKVAALLDHYHGPFAVVSFNPHSLAWFARNRPHWPRGLNGNKVGNRELKLYPNIDHIGLFEGKIGLAQPHFLSFDVPTTIGKAGRMWRKRGHPIITWVLRTTDEVQEVGEFCDNFMFEWFTA